MHWAVALLALAGLVIFVFILRWERGVFTRKGKGSAWLAVRLCLVPIVIVTVAAVYLPARSISGMEALAYFYAALFTIGPMLWFGLHWLAGKLVKPRLDLGEAVMLALIPLTYLGLLAGLGQALQPVVWGGLRAANEAGFDRAKAAPSPYAPPVARRYRAANGEVVTMTWARTREVKIERVDFVVDGVVARDAGRQRRDQLCQEASALRFVTASTSPVPTLHIYFREGASLQRAELVPATPIPEAVAFEVRWENGTFALPEAFPRMAVQLVRLREGREPGYFSGGLEFFQPGESPDMNCMPPGWRPPFPIDGVTLFVQRTQGGPVRLEAMRPAPGGT